MAISNPIYEEFVALGLINPASVERMPECTRDSAVPVYRDTQSKIVFLERVETSATYYAAKKAGDRDGAVSVVATSRGEPMRSAALGDAHRRLRQFEAEIRGQVLCDFGAGYGEFLDGAVGVAKQCFGVELRRHCMEAMTARGLKADVRESISAHDMSFDVVTMFHVLEHMPFQVQSLRDIVAHLNPGGKVIVEVPHAEDFLIQSVDLPEFRAFTFWSEHLVLHTRASLRRVMEEAGLRAVTILPYQRYGFTNHLHWFLERKPGGHEALARFENADLEQAYRTAREADGTCDTLIGIGSA